MKFFFFFLDRLFGKFSRYRKKITMEYDGNGNGRVELLGEYYKKMRKKFWLAAN